MTDDADRVDDAEVLHRIRGDVERAMNAGDPGVFDDHATGDVVVLPVAGTPDVGREACKAGMADFFEAYEVDSIDYDSDEVHVGEVFAFDRGSVTERYRPGDREEWYEFLFSYLFLYRRSGGDWKLFRIVWKQTEPTE